MLSIYYYCAQIYIDVFSNKDIAQTEALSIYPPLEHFSFRKIPKAPGLIFFKGPLGGAYFWRGLYSEGLIYGGKFTVFAFFYFVFERNFQVQAPGGLIFGGAI